MTYDSIQPMLQWIAAHPTWAGFAVFLISLSESLAIVGLVVPGVVMMTAIGAMMGGGVLPFWETLSWAILGAIAGDGISYWLGYRYHQQLREFWPFRQFPQLLIRGEKFFSQHGGKSIIFGRFVGPVRPMIPVIAGMMDMSPKRFLFFNVVSAIAWAPLYSLPGILIGASLGTLSPEVARRIVFLILMLLLVLWLIYAFLLKIGAWLGRGTLGIVNHLWLRVQASHRLTFLHKTLSNAQGMEESQLGFLLLFLLSGLAFMFTTLNAAHAEGLALWNEPIYQALRALHADSITQWTLLFAGLGEPIVVVVITTTIAAFLCWHKRYIAMSCWLSTIFGGLIVGAIARELITMSRPEGLVYLHHQYSYPSGHALSAMLLYGLAAAFIHPVLAPAHRYLPWAISIPLILLISFSRLYLGLHWFTDVIGGLTIGVCAIAIGLFIFRRFEAKPPTVRVILLPALIALVLMMAYYSIAIYPTKKTEAIRQWSSYEFETKTWWTGHSQLNDLHRSGAFKRIATVFNIQWLGPLDHIQALLKRHQWQSVPTLTFNSGLTFLVDKPNPQTMPVLPKFHRDRLPVLVVMHSENPNERLVLQLWQSDYVSENAIPLWVGTLRVETIKHPLPMTTFFLETPPTSQIMIPLDRELRALKIPCKMINKGVDNPPILLIDSSLTPYP
jgi:membrane protein DedA with SNARE-associated domain